MVSALPFVVASVDASLSDVVPAEVLSVSPVVSGGSVAADVPYRPMPDLVLVDGVGKPWPPSWRSHLPTLDQPTPPVA